MFILALSAVVLLLPVVEGGCRERAANTPNMLGAQQWFCDSDGSYSARQCSGSGCYCADRDGKSLGYFTNHGQDTANMDCNCARRKAEIPSRLVGQMIYCDSKGSFAPVQCQGSVCFCADQNGREMLGSQRVNIGNIDELECAVPF